MTKASVASALSALYKTGQHLMQTLHLYCAECGSSHFTNSEAVKDGWQCSQCATHNLQPTILDDPHSKRLPCYICRDTSLDDSTTCPHLRYAVMSRHEVLMAVKALAKEAHCRPYVSKEHGTTHLWTTVYSGSILLTFNSDPEEIESGWNRFRVPLSHLYGMPRSEWMPSTRWMEHAGSSPAKDFEALVGVLLDYERQKSAPPEPERTKVKWWHLW